MRDRILIPYDGSDHSRRAPDRVLSSDEASERFVLHVREPGADRESGESGAVSDRIVRDARTRAVTYCRDVETVQLTGEPSDEIVDFAVTNKIDAIVMGSRGRSQPNRSTPGSVANAVIERAPVTVTIVRESLLGELVSESKTASVCGGDV